MTSLLPGTRIHSIWSFDELYGLCASQYFISVSEIIKVYNKCPTLLQVADMVVVEVGAAPKEGVT